MSKTGAYSRCTGLLIFYDEPLELLAESVSSHLPLIDHLVAVDGAYILYPESLPRSDPSLMRMISALCDGARVGLTAHTPLQVWSGNEVQKRNHAVRLAEAVTDSDGWYLSFDADHVVTHAAEDWFQQLQQVADESWGAIDVGIRDTRPIPGFAVPPTDGYSAIRTLFRALPGVEYGPAHWVMRIPDFEGVGSSWTYLRAPTEWNPVSAYDGTHLMQFDHRQVRPTYRNEAKRLYAERRDQFGIENFSQNT